VTGHKLLNGSCTQRQVYYSVGCNNRNKLKLHALRKNLSCNAYTRERVLQLYIRVLVETLFYSSIIFPHEIHMTSRADRLELGGLNYSIFNIIPMGNMFGSYVSVLFCMVVRFKN